MKYKVDKDQVAIYGYILNKGSHIINLEQDFLITEGNYPALLSLLRAISGSGLPVLLEGPTSAGKTSLVNYVAQLIG